MAGSLYNTSNVAVKFSDRGSENSSFEDSGNSDRHIDKDRRSSASRGNILDFATFYRHKNNSNANCYEKINDCGDFQRERNELVAVIEKSYFDYGIWTEADEFFDKLKVKHGSMYRPLKLVANVASGHTEDEHILEGVLHILYNFSYDEIEQYGLSIPFSCSSIKSTVVQDLLIACFEKWESNSNDIITILEGLEIDKAWLSEYRDEVLSQLKSMDTSIT